MTNFTTRMMIATATLVAAAGAASAQTLRAEIPFTFRAGNKVMAAGTYEVGTVSGQTDRPIFRLSAVGAGHTTLLPGMSPHDAAKSWQAAGNPVLSFDCAAGNCSLATVWTGFSAPAYRIPYVKAGADEPVRVTLIEMRRDKSE